MPEENHKDKKDLQAQVQPPNSDVGLDAAGRSLSEALRMSFIILKIIIVILVIVFLASGFRTVGPDEKALVLRFGKIHGVGEKRLLGPGLHWVFPYPVDELVKIPVEKKINIPINSFWYYQHPLELVGGTAKEEVSRRAYRSKTLDPVKDGYCITRGEKQIRLVAGFSGSDYNIVHSKWQLTYQIDDPERFFRNVYIDMENLQSGQNYADVIEKDLTGLLEHLVEDAIVKVMVHYTIDQAISSEDTIPRHVERLLQQKLEKIESGVKVVSVQLTSVSWPRQVNDAFLASIKASQESQKSISEAKTYAEKTLNKAAGPVCDELFKVISGRKKITSRQEEFLWEQLAGSAQEVIAHARAYRTEVVENARANAEYLHNILGEYRQRPKLVVQKIYLDAMEYVFNNVDEKIVIQPAEGKGPKEIQVQINRDPAIKPKTSEEKEASEFGS